MRVTSATWFRIAAFASVVLWLGAFWFPAYLVPSKWSGGYERYAWDGLEVFLFGWIGSLAWYANPLWIWNTWRMAIGRAPHLWAALLAALMAVTAYSQIDAQDFDDSAFGNAKAAFGVTVWVVSFAPALFAATIDGMRSVWLHFRAHARTAHRAN